MAHAKKGGAHTGRQHRGPNMHLTSVKGDKFAHPGPHAGPKDMHIGHLLTPPEDYQDGGETTNENCEHD